MKTSLAVAGNVRAALGRRSVTQARAAEHLQMSRDAFSRRITGKVPFDVAELEALSRFLEVSYSSLVEIQEDQ
ncbi:helix-turn-helix domain-containing protein [Kocuria sp. HSID16901]|uniref:helix-turn-helix domain-containing protein n=1 Tax=Kocuria sp. HSID16901 TaxID=2419505 RepID=UPI000F87E614|nr:helix-turn-helix transcriptional regulator [Kocuria sp. HSID16901]